MDIEDAKKMLAILEELKVEQTEIKTFFDEPFFETKKVLFIRV